MITSFLFLTQYNALAREFVLICLCINSKLLAHASYVKSSCTNAAFHCCCCFLPVDLPIFGYARPESKKLNVKIKALPLPLVGRLPGFLFLLAVVSHSSNIFSQTLMLFVTRFTFFARQLSFFGIKLVCVRIIFIPFCYEDSRAYPT